MRMKIVVCLLVCSLLVVLLGTGKGEAAARPSANPTGGLTLTVNAAAGQHPISPHIYGINFAPADLAADLDLPVNRWGGNATSLYNWQLDARNLGSDWYFENYPNENANPGNLPYGSDSDEFVQQNLSTGTETLLTIPMTGWAAKSREICVVLVLHFMATKSMRILIVQIVATAVTPMAIPLWAMTPMTPASRWMKPLSRGG